MKFVILCDRCYQPCYECDGMSDYEYIEMDELRKIIYEHKTSDECKKRLASPKFPLTDHDYIL